MAFISNCEWFDAVNCKVSQHEAIVYNHCARFYFSTMALPWQFWNKLYVSINGVVIKLISFQHSIALQQTNNLETTKPTIFGPCFRATRVAFTGRIDCLDLDLWIVFNTLSSWKTSWQRPRLNNKLSNFDPVPITLKDDALNVSRRK